MTLGQSRLNFLVGTTCLGGALMACKTVDVTSGGRVAAVVCVTLGTYLIAASASMQNQIIEKDHDKKMDRTRHRPLPAGRLTPAKVNRVSNGLAFGGSVVMACGSYMLLTPEVSPWFCIVGPALALGNRLQYTHVYTRLKRISQYNTEVGALFGALPPIIGWLAIRAPAMGWDALQWVHLVEPMSFFAIMWCWQMQHFMIIAHRYKDDYNKGGYSMRQDGILKHGGLVGAVPLNVIPFLMYYSGVLPNWVSLVIFSAFSLVLGYAYLGALCDPSKLFRAQLTGYVYILAVFFLLFVFYVPEPTVEKGYEFDLFLSLKLLWRKVMNSIFQG